MVAPTRLPANGFVAAVRKLYNPLGFAKGYNFVLWFVFAGALMGFVLARLQFLSFHGIFCSANPSSSLSHAAPGECFYYLNVPHERAGIIIHLAAILPAAFLACFQFTPVIRHRAMLVHRVCGYVVLLLSLLATVGAFMIARHAFGGSLATQAGLGFLGIAFLGSLVLAYVNIKRLQIEQHRAWMLRAWFYAGSIITLRLIMFIAATIISRQGGYYDARPCDQVADLLGGRNATLARYPECGAYFSSADPAKHVAVAADLKAGAAGAAAALGINFGMALWLALAMHAVGVEVYLQLTPAEAERLRNFSYQRQLEAGMGNAGRAGLTVDRLGDSALWVPAEAGGKMHAGQDDSSLQTAAG